MALEQGVRLVVALEEVGDQRRVHVAVLEDADEEVVEQHPLGVLAHDALGVIRTDVLDQPSIP